MNDPHIGQTQLHSYREGRPPDVIHMSETKLKIGCFLCLCLKECRYCVNGYGMPHSTWPIRPAPYSKSTLCVWCGCVEDRKEL